MNEIEAGSMPVFNRAVPMAPLYDALAKAQGSYEPIMKNRLVTIQTLKGGQYRFRYADLEEILSKTRKALSDNGLSVMQLVTQEPSGVKLVTTLAHSSGAIIESTVNLAKPIDGDIKAFGATITFWRRYVICPLLNVAADDDLDEEGEETRDTRVSHKPARHAPPPPPDEPAPEQGPPFDGAEPIQVHDGLRDAKSISELAKVMSGLKKEEKQRFAAYFMVRQGELKEAS